MNLNKLLVYLLEESIAHEPTDDNQLVEYVEEVAQYPEGFDIKTLKTLPSFAEKKRYIMKFLPYMGAGSSRIVFAADNGTVLKLAKNQKGIAQNEAEYDISQYAEDSGFEDLITKVLDSDPDNLWVESERARKATSADWKKIYGITQREAMFKLWQNLSTSRRSFQRDNIAELEKSNPKFVELLKALQNFMEVNSVLSGDIARPSSWGVVSRNREDRLILLDYGYTAETQKLYR